MIAIVILSAFVAGVSVGIGFADAIARQKVKRWAVVRELMGLD